MKIIERFFGKESSIIHGIKWNKKIEKKERKKERKNIFKKPKTLSEERLHGNNNNKYHWMKIKNEKIYIRIIKYVRKKKMKKKITKEKRKERKKERKS